MTRLSASMRRWPALLLLAAACGKAGPPPRPPVLVATAVAQSAPAPYLIAANGIVEPMQTVAVQSQVQGVLVAVRFREGDEVQQGQVLFEIDPVPYQAALRQAQGALARDRAQYENARRDADRYASLAQKDFVTRSQADQALANAEALKAVVQADSASLASAQFNLDQATIRAPVSGKTGGLLVKQGNLVKPGANPPLVVINQIHPILVRFTVPEREFAKVQEYSRKGSLVVRATPRGSARPVQGTLSFVDNGVDTTTGNVMLKGRFDNADGSLWPGQFVAVQLQLFVDPAAVQVPATAVMTGQEGQYVFVVDKDGKAQMQPVQAGRLIDDRIVIDGGLAAGATVVTDGQLRLTPGAKVEVKAPAAPKAMGAAPPAPAAADAKPQGTGAR